MRIVKSFNKNVGITYVYEVVESHYDKEKGISVPKRRMIGHLDPVTGELVPNRKRGRKKTDSPIESEQKSVEAEQNQEKTASVPNTPDYKKLYLERDQETDRLKKEISVLRDKVESLESILNSIHDMTALQK